MGNKISDKKNCLEDFNLLISEDKLISKKDLLYIFHTICKKKNKNIFYILNKKECIFPNLDYNIENYNCNQTLNTFSNFLREFKPTGLVKMDFIPIWIKLYMCVDKIHLGDYLKGALKDKCSCIENDNQTIIYLDVNYNSYVREISKYSLYAGVSKIYINDIISKINFPQLSEKLFFFKDFLKVEYINVFILGLSKNKIDLDLQTIKNSVPSVIFNEFENKIDFKQ